MIIPKAITVGPIRYTIKRVEYCTPPPHAYGQIHFHMNEIHIAGFSFYGSRYSQKKQQETFWHEALHACYADMGVPYERHDEKMIDELAKRIAQICRTAEL